MKCIVKTLDVPVLVVAGTVLGLALAYSYVTTQRGWR